LASPIDIARRDFEARSPEHRGGRLSASSSAA
jgi:hypothetical protein